MHFATFSDLASGSNCLLFSCVTIFLLRLNCAQSRTNARDVIVEQQRDVRNSYWDYNSGLPGDESTDHSKVSTEDSKKAEARENFRRLLMEAQSFDEIEHCFDGRMYFNPNCSLRHTHWTPSVSLTEPHPRPLMMADEPMRMRNRDVTGSSIRRRGLSKSEGNRFFRRLYFPVVWIL